MIWHNFIYFYPCRSDDYMKIIGENNMDMRMIYWTKITLPES